MRPGDFSSYKTGWGVGHIWPHPLTIAEHTDTMSFSAISRKQKFCPTSRLSPNITLANMDMELGKGSIECITIYKGEYCSSEERLHYEYLFGQKKPLLKGDWWTDSPPNLFQSRLPEK